MAGVRAGCDDGPEGRTQDQYPSSDAELRRIVFDHRSSYLDLVGCPDSERKTVVQSARAPIREAGFDPYSIEMVVFQKFISELLDGVTRRITMRRSR